MSVDELLYKALDKSMNCQDQINNMVVYTPTTNNPETNTVCVKALVDQSYGTTTEATQKDVPAHEVWMQFRTDGASSGAVEVKGCIAAYCGCLAGQVGCTHQSAAWIAAFALRRNSAAVGRAKQAPTKPSTKAKVPVRLAKFALGGDTLHRFLSESADLNGDELELLAEMMERRRKKKEKKKKKKKPKKKKDTSTYAQYGSKALTEIAAARDTVGAVFTAQARNHINNKYVRPRPPPRCSLPLTNIRMGGRLRSRSMPRLPAARSLVLTSDGGAPPTTPQVRCGPRHGSLAGIRQPPVFRVASRARPRRPDRRGLAESQGGCCVAEGGWCAGANPAAGDAVGRGRESGVACAGWRQHVCVPAQRGGQACPPVRCQRHCAAARRLTTTDDGGVDVAV